MSAPSLRPAELDDAALARIRSLEERIGAPVVAYEPQTPYASLTAEQLAEVRSVERELSVRLLAFRD